MKPVFLSIVMFILFTGSTFGALTPEDLDAIRMIIREELAASEARLQKSIEASGKRLETHISQSVSNLNATISEMDNNLGARLSGLKKRLDTLFYLLIALGVVIVFTVGVPQIIWVIQLYTENKQLKTQQEQNGSS